MRPTGGLLKLDQDAEQLLCSHAQLGSKDREAGGVMIGRYLSSEPHVIVDVATAPCSKDKRSRRRFERSKAHHQRIIDEAWQQSRGTSVYLGEWHTHPEDQPEPSSVDWDDWRRHLREDQIDGETAFFLIVGRKTVRVWEANRDRKAFSACIQGVKSDR